MATSSVSMTVPPQGEDDVPRHFHLFSKLPIELRFDIWELSIKPRMISIYRLKTIPIPSPPRARRHRVPAILQATRESRTVGLKHYELVFKRLLWTSAVYFNFALDILAFNDIMLNVAGETMPVFFRQKEDPAVLPDGQPPIYSFKQLKEVHPQLRFLMIPREWLCYGTGGAPFHEGLFEFKNLRQLNIVYFEEGVFGFRGSFSSQDFHTWNEKQTAYHKRKLMQWKQMSQSTTTPVLRSINAQVLIGLYISNPVPCGCHVTSPSLPALSVTGEVATSPDGYGNMLGGEYAVDFAMRKGSARGTEGRERVELAEEEYYRLVAKPCCYT
ncbi:hypothetical protein HYFRA_00013121 [Hymenoscyphus fraxineus]|uniref:2EXR domain-containing protein n=1 Tax=Hymenoscyphus fraxineus TaxID=746836 RepID=A0A9N9L338_9HELO|nr:hypothetical protein HYFRA_00013121 [Hymenoscyphus fraxineus]